MDPLFKVIFNDYSVIGLHILQISVSGLFVQELSLVSLRTVRQTHFNVNLMPCSLKLPRK